MRPALLVLVLLAGCITPDAADPAATLSFGAPVAVSTEAPGAEPVIAVARDGTIYVEGIGNDGDGNVNKVWRSDDGGDTWTDVTPPQLGQERSNDGFVAVADDGTVYAANVFSLTFQVFRSDDKGATWTHLTMPAMPPLMHRHWIVPIGERTVHVAVEALPPSFAPYLAGIPPPEGGATDGHAGMWYYRSDDRGASWSEPVQIDPVVNFAGQGTMATSADGLRLYIPRYREPADPTAYTYDDGTWYLLASEDGGDTWETRPMFDLTSELSTAVPALALSADGTLTFAWSQEDAGSSRVRLATSTDAGRTWSAPQGVSGNGTQAMAFAAAHGDRVGLMWYQADIAGTASQVDADWFVHYWEAGRETRVTSTPQHRGNICARGPACEGEEDRSLLDYPWMDFDADGRAHLVWASTEWDRPSAFAVVAVQR